MGIFDFWKKKKKDEVHTAAEPAPETETAQAEPEQSETPVPETAPEEPKVQADFHALLEVVLEKCKGGEWDGDSAVYFPDCKLRLTVECGESNLIQDKHILQLLFIMEHPFFDETMVESVAGVGATVEDALKHGTESFCAGVLTYVLGALQCTGEAKITATLQGRDHVFRLPCTMAIQHMGNPSLQPCDLWRLVESTIPQYLGNKKAYWIKLFAACMDTPACEARINGIVYPELTDILRKAAKEHKIGQNCTDKMFVLLIQDDATYTPCPFTKDEVEELAFAALDRMKNITDAESHQRIFTEIQQMTDKGFLGGELCVFLPEIYSRAVVGYRCSDLLSPTSIQNEKIRKSQVTSYSYLESIVVHYLRQKRPSAEDNLKIMRLSAEFKAINQAVHNGAKLENLQLSPLAYNTPEGYIIY